MTIEVVWRQRLSEEVGVVVARVLVLDNDVPLGDPLADLEEAPLDVTRALRAFTALFDSSTAPMLSTQRTVGLLMS